MTSRATAKVVHNIPKHQDQGALHGIHLTASERIDAIEVCRAASAWAHLMEYPAKVQLKADALLEALVDRSRRP